MVNNELVSVIMSIYNEPIDIIKKSVLSILNQTYSNLEIVIVNDNPARMDIDIFCLEISSHDHRVNYINNKKNMGLVFSLNTALDFCSGEYVARMDADDISCLDRIEKQLRYIKDNSLDMIGSSVQLIDEADKKIGQIITPVDNSLIVKMYKFGAYLMHPTWLVKKNVYLQLNGYRDIYSCEDYDFVIRAILHNFKLGNIKECLLQYRVRSTSISNSSKIQQILTTNFLKRQLKYQFVLPVSKVNEYLNSKRYINDYSNLKQYLLIKNQIKSKKMNPKNILYILGNKYFYYNFLNYINKHVVNKIYYKNSIEHKVY